MPKEFWAGNDGISAEDITGQRSAMEGEQSTRAGVAGRSGIANALRQLGSGQMSLEDFMAKGEDGAVQDQLRQLGLTDAMSGRRLAGEAVRGDPTSNLLFGEQGLAQDLSAEGKRLAETGGRMTASDEEAFGQASDRIARLAAQQEQGLAQQLAGRGFGRGASGVAGAAFSGLQGNKFEQLARAQQQIASDRKEKQLQQLQENRRMQAQLGQQYGQELGAQFGRAQSARQMGQQERQTQAQSDMQNRAMQQQQLNEQFAQKQQTARKGFFRNMGDALTSGMSEGLAFMSGGGIDDVAGAFAGGMGKAAGSGMMSDENNKEDVSFSAKEVSDLFRAMQPASFEYSEEVADLPGAGRGRRLGVMAQDVESAGPVGESMVMETPAGKMLDKDALLSALLAQGANLQKEVDQVKGRRRKA